MSVRDPLNTAQPLGSAGFDYVDDDIESGYGYEQLDSSRSGKEEQRAADYAILQSERVKHLEMPPKTWGQYIYDGLGSSIKIGVAGACKVLSLTFVRDCVRGAYRCCVKPDREILIDAYKEAVSDRFVGVRPFDPAMNELDSPAVHDFQNQLSQLNIQSLAEDPDAMRKKIVALSKHPGYINLLECGRRDHPAVRYLQDLGVRLESADARQAFQEYGQRRSGQFLPSGTCPFTTLVDATRHAQGQFSSHRDSKCATFCWGISHLGYLSHVEMAHLREENYDSYENQTVFMGDTLVDVNRIHIKFTPGLTGPNSIVEDVLIPAYRDQGQRWIFINNQSMHERNERARINVVQGWSERHNDTFRQAVLSTDICKQGEFSALLSEFERGDINVAAYFDEFSRLARGDDDSRIRNYAQSVGFYIPVDLLNQNELNAAFAAARAMIIDNASNAQFTQKELADVVLRTVTSVLSWAIMKKEQLSHPDSIFSTACKEMIDRAVMEYLEIRGNELMCQNLTEMPTNDAEFVSGVVLGRGHAAMDRPPQKKRLKPIVTRAAYFQGQATFSKGNHELQGLRALLLQGAQQQERGVIRAVRAHQAERLDRKEEEKT